MKFQLIEINQELLDSEADQFLAKGVIERIGGQSLLRFESEVANLRTATAVRNHKEAIYQALDWLIKKAKVINTASDVGAIGHRVVHGGEELTKSCLITGKVLQKIQDCIELAPLHNPANLEGISAATDVFGKIIPQVAVFDTAFHSSMKEESFLYGIPYQYYRRHKIRKYGFHGSSHRYVQYRYRNLKGHSIEDNHLISLHLGNGCSACAIESSRSIETSMGMTPIEGLLMGTRSGDIDPSILEFLSHKEGLSISQVDTMLNKQSGLLGVSGLTHDMRDLIAEVEEYDDRRAKLALNIFVKRIAKYIGAYLALLTKGCKAIVFTGGIGENAILIREMVCKQLAHLGIELDEELNSEMVGGKEGLISKEGSKYEVYIIPTNEELIIARDTFRAISKN